MNFEKPLVKQADQAEKSKGIKEEPLTENKNEHKTEHQEFFDNLLDKVILDTYKKINSGQHGVIGLFDLKQTRQSFVEKTNQLLDVDESEQEKLSQELNEVFVSRFGEMAEGDDKMAIKMLKIFSEEAGNREAAMQKKAYEIIEKARQENPDKQYAGVPKVYFNKAINLLKEPEIRQKLKNDNVNTLSSKAYLMVMDYYDGDDFAEHLYRSALVDEGGLSQAEVKALNFDELKKKVSTLKIPGVKSLSSPSSRLTPLQIYRENNKALLDRYSKKHGALDEEIFDKVQNTVQLLNSNNLYHRDLHERNIFLSKKEDQVSDVHILDFGTSKESAPGERFEDIYRDGQRACIKDGYFVASYRDIGRDREIEEI